MLNDKPLPYGWLLVAPTRFPKIELVIEYVVSSDTRMNVRTAYSVVRAISFFDWTICTNYFYFKLKTNYFILFKKSISLSFKLNFIK